MNHLWLQPDVAQSIMQQAASEPYGLIKIQDNQILGIIPKQLITADDFVAEDIQGIYQTVALKSNPPWDNIIVLVVMPSSQFKVWRIQNGRVMYVTLHTNEEHLYISEMLSFSQKTAILIMGVMAITLMIVLSIYLLPAAPPIP